MNVNDQPSSSTNETTFTDSREREDYRSSDNDFLEVNLEHYKPWRFPTPTTIQTLVAALKRNRLLVLSGEAEVNRSHLARHIAWYLQDTKGAELSDTPGSLIVKEWRRNSDPQKLLVEIQKTKQSTIFLLTEVLPRDISVDFHELQDAASTRNYIIVSSSLSWNEWKLPATVETTFWHNLPTVGLFSTESLAEAFISRLLEVREWLPTGLNIEGPDIALCGSITPSNIAGQLKSLHRIQEFVSAFRSKEGEVTEEWIIETLTPIATKRSITIEEFFDQWYQAYLEPRSRLLALNLSFFDGAYEDQFFGALETLLSKVWRDREPLLKAYDYDDMVPLELFFDLIPTRSEDRVVQMRLPDQRYLLLRRAWFSHRRQIIAALPILVEMVRQSVRPRPLDRELYGSRNRRERLREAISLTLSDIGRIENTVVQPILLQLAADAYVGSQMVAAEAMARWRYYGQDQKLFDTLWEWQHNTRILDIVRFLLEEQPSPENERAETHIRATIALTIARAARYDPPNQLNETIVKIFMNLATDSNRVVRSRLRNHTLPSIIRHHHLQLREQLRELAQQPDLIRAIGGSLALAYETNPKETLQTLQMWHDEASNITPQLISQGRKVGNLQVREGLLAVIARTYGEIEYPIEPEEIKAAKRKGLLTADKAFDYLKQLLQREKHPIVRTEIVIGLVNQAKRDIMRVDELLQKCMEAVIEEERDAIVSEFTELYMKQRAEVTGGKAYIAVQNYSYPIWDSSAERPTTAIEMTLQRWLKDSEYVAAQQIAARAFIAFASRLDRQLAEETQRLEAERAAAAQLVDQEELPGLVLQFPRKNLGWYPRFAVWLATLAMQDYRRTIENILSEINPEAAYKTVDSASVTFVLNKWGLSNDKDIRQIGQGLQGTLWFLQHQRMVLGMMAVVVLLFLCVICQIF